jgi:HD-like signal output (HDOD) protein
MLAGLIHNIGALPVLAMAETQDELVQDETELDRIIDILSPQVGQRILRMWGFPESLIQVPLRHLQMRTPTLEDLFLELTGHSLRN